MGHLMSAAFNVVPGKWLRVEFDDWRNIPRKTPAAVYVIFGDGRPLYVGQSVKVRDRLLDHDIIYARYSDRIEIPWILPPPRNVWAKVRFFTRIGEHLMREARLIYRLRPGGNTIGLGPSRAAVLR